MYLPNLPLAVVPILCQEADTPAETVEYIGSSRPSYHLNNNNNSTQRTTEGILFELLHLD